MYSGDNPARLIGVVDQYRSNPLDDQLLTASSGPVVVPMGTPDVGPHLIEHLMAFTSRLCRLRLLQHLFDTGAFPISDLPAAVVQPLPRGVLGTFLLRCLDFAYIGIERTKIMLLEILNEYCMPF